MSEMQPELKQSINSAEMCYLTMHKLLPWASGEDEKSTTTDIVCRWNLPVAASVSLGTSVRLAGVSLLPIKEMGGKMTKLYEFTTTVYFHNRKQTSRQT